MIVLSPQLLAWCVLRRVVGGGVVKLGNRWLEHGRRTPMHLAETFDALTVAGLVVLADPDPVAVGQRRASATEAGRIRYAQLCRWQAEQLRSPAAPAPLVAAPGLTGGTP